MIVLLVINSYHPQDYVSRFVVMELGLVILVMTVMLSMVMVAPLFALSSSTGNVLPHQPPTHLLAHFLQMLSQLLQQKV